MEAGWRSHLGVPSIWADLWVLGGGDVAGLMTTTMITENYRSFHNTKT
jgi:hypothetical protein